MFPVNPRGVGRDDADTIEGVKGPSRASRRATSKWGLNWALGVRSSR
jgi:hypothetical protein